jgi:hypothetical protein
MKSAAAGFPPPLFHARGAGVATRGRMTLGPSRIDATPAQPTAAAVAAQARANWRHVQAMVALDRMHGQDAREPQPAAKPVQTTAEIRDEVMAERGVDRLDLVQLSAQARLEAEISIEAETAQRARQAKARATGAIVDIKA